MTHPITMAMNNSEELSSFIYLMANEFNKCARHLLKRDIRYGTSDIRKRLMQCFRIMIPQLSEREIGQYMSDEKQALVHYYVQSVHNHKNWSYLSKTDRQNGRVAVLRLESKSNKPKKVSKHIKFPAFKDAASVGKRGPENTKSRHAVAKLAKRRK